MHQRLLSRLEKWNLVKLKEESAKSHAPAYIGEYTLLEGCLSEKDLWVLVGTKSSTSQQCVLAAKKASDVPCGIRQRAACWLREVILLLYLALVRPCPECCVLFWSSQYKRLDRV